MSVILKPTFKARTEGSRDCECIPLDAVVFHVILSEAKDLSSLDSSAPPQNDTLDEVVYTRTN